jgi:hypothetical protein
MGARRLLRRYRALSKADRRLLVRAFVRLIIVDMGLRAFGFRRLVERAGQQCAPANRGVDPRDVLDPTGLRRSRCYARWLEVASRYHVVRARCLHRSIALHRWLCEEGLPSELRIGVLKDGGELKAHAWVELGGHVVNDPPRSVEAFVPLLRLRSVQPFVRSVRTDGTTSSKDPVSTNLRAVTWQ